MSGSGMGDKMDLVHTPAKDASPNKVGVYGWFDIKHTCAETGKVTDFSGPNAITRDGLGALCSGLNPGTTGFPAATAANTVCGILLTGTGTAFSPGADVGTGTYSALAPGTTGDVIAPFTNTALGNGTTSNPDTSTSMYFKSSAGGDPGTDPVDIFDSASTDADPMVTSIATITVKNLGTTQRTVNGIFVADCHGTAGATIKLLAGRVASGSGTAAMTEVVMNQNDTLAIDYSISVDAT